MTDKVTQGDAYTQDFTSPGSSTWIAADSQFYKPTLALIYGIILLSVLSAIINPLTVCSMLVSGALKKTATNILIFSLCCSDFAMGFAMALSKIRHVISLKNHMDSNSVAVLSWIAATLICIGYFSSLIIVLLIGVDRALATAMPAHHRNIMTIKRSMYMFFSLWLVIAVMVFSPLAIRLEQIKNTDKLPVLTYPTEIFPMNFTMKFTTPFILSCLVGSTLLYGVVVIAFLRVQKRLHIKSSSKEKRSQRMTKMILIVVCFLYIFNGPIIVLGALKVPIPTYDPSKINLHHMMYEFAALLTVFPTFCNNFMYAWHLEDFRRGHMKLFGCHRNSVGPTSSTIGHSGSTEPTK